MWSVEIVWEPKLLDRNLTGVKGKRRVLFPLAPMGLSSGSHGSFNSGLWATCSPPTHSDWSNEASGIIIVCSPSHYYIFSLQPHPPAPSWDGDAGLMGQSYPGLPLTELAFHEWEAQTAAVAATVMVCRKGPPAWMVGNCLRALVMLESWWQRRVMGWEREDWSGDGDWPGAGQGMYSRACIVTAAAYSLPGLDMNPWAHLLQSRWI